MGRNDRRKRLAGVKIGAEGGSARRKPVICGKAAATVTVNGAGRRNGRQNSRIAAVYQQFTFMVQEEIKSRRKLGNACCYSVQNLVIQVTVQKLKDQDI